jgi:hypothetical protein
LDSISSRSIFSDFLHGANKFVSSAITKSQNQIHSSVFGSELDWSDQELFFDQRKFGSVADCAKTHIFDPSSMKVQIAKRFLKGHQSGDFKSRTFPVFFGERVKCKMFYAELTTSGCDFTNSFNAFAMTFNAIKIIGFGPSAIAIHDDPNMEAGTGEDITLPGFLWIFFREGRRFF